MGSTAVIYAVNFLKWDKTASFNFFPEQQILIYLFLLQGVSPDIVHAASTIDLLSGAIKKYEEGHVCVPDVTKDDLYAFEKLKLDLDELHHKWQSIFVWQDGPLVKAMRDGDLFLVDEISLADDSVLERLNSVLEPERKLVSDHVCVLDI